MLAEDVELHFDAPAAARLEHHTAKVGKRPAGDNHLQVGGGWGGLGCVCVVVGGVGGWGTEGVGGRRVYIIRGGL